ncbi:MAG: DUF721 domain-containing protein [Rhizobiaceae bacterium]|nr:MAG: DUF721 domain-containing protein [Rhizobiaceae bacterium]
MAAKKRTAYVRPLSDVASEIIDPMLRRRAGISIGLVQSWEEIAGEKLSASTRPERILWPRRAHEDDPFAPATLVIACEGMAALRLQHETGEIIQRINAFLGFAAIGRIRIAQKPVGSGVEKARPVLRQLSPTEESLIVGTVQNIENDALRASLENLGKTIMASRKK